MDIISSCLTLSYWNLKYSATEDQLPEPLGTQTTQPSVKRLRKPDLFSLQKTKVSDKSGCLTVLEKILVWWPGEASESPSWMLLRFG